MTPVLVAAAILLVLVGIALGITVFASLARELLG